MRKAVNFAGKIFNDAFQSNCFLIVESRFRRRLEQHQHFNFENVLGDHKYLWNPVGVAFKIRGKPDYVERLELVAVRHGAAGSTKTLLKNCISAISFRKSILSGVSAKKSSNDMRNFIPTAFSCQALVYAAIPCVSAFNSANPLLPYSAAIWSNTKVSDSDSDSISAAACGSYCGYRRSVKRRLRTRSSTLSFCGGLPSMATASRPSSRFRVSHGVGPYGSAS